MRSILKWRKPPWLFPVLMLTSCGAPARLDLTSITQLVNSTRASSFPGLKDAEINVRDLTSDSIFLEAQFTMASYVFGGRLRYVLSYNSEASRRHVPAEGLRAIVAHELAHIEFFQGQSRTGLA